MISYRYIYVAFMNLNVQPTSHFKTILSGNTLASKKSLSGIVKDLKKSPGMSAHQKRMVKRTVYNLNTNPNAVVTNRESKAVVATMRDRGHLKTKYKDNLGGAIRQVQHTYSAEEQPTTDKDGNPVKKLSKREREKQERKKEARMQMLARERRDEAEREKKGIKYSVGNNVQVSAKSTGGMSEDIKKTQKDRFEKKQAIDMMID